VQPKDLLDDFQSLFGDFFGSATLSRHLSVTLEVSLVEIAHGAEREVELVRAFACEACKGTGGAPQAVWQGCEECDGTGGATETHGFLQVQSTCVVCAGRRGSWSEPCSRCQGRKQTATPKSVRVRVPPGVADGSHLRLVGLGNDLGDGQGPGDAFVRIVTQPHPTLRRDGDDLRARVYVEPALATAGGSVQLPWLTGSVSVKVPAGIDSDTDIRLSGWGCVRLGSEYSDPPAPDAPYRTSSATGRGDLVVTLTTQPIVVEAPHEVLGVRSDASFAEIQQAYRKLAMELHPDRRPGDPEAARRFEAVSAAYTQLVSGDEARLRDALEEHAPPQASFSRGAQAVAILLVVALAALFYILR
jgi:DnaJ-class molecular chaperone